MLYHKFTDKSVGKRILKIGQYLAKLKAKIQWHLFSGHGIYSSSSYSGRKTEKSICE